MKEIDIESDAKALIANKIAAGEPVEMTWAVHELIEKVGGIEGEGAPFYRLCAREHVYGVVKSVVNRYDRESPNESDPQMLLKGFECLKCAYTVPREGTTKLMPIEHMTYDEIEARAVIYDQHSETMKKHARELRRYARERRAANPEPAAQPATEESAV